MTSIAKIKQVLWMFLNTLGSMFSSKTNFICLTDKSKYITKLRNVVSNDSKKRKEKLVPFPLAKLISFDLQMKRVHHKTNEKSLRSLEKKVRFIGFLPMGGRDYALV